jgi:hypothetical protein
MCEDLLQDQLQHNPGAMANGGRLSCATGFRVVLSVLHKTMQTKRHPLFDEEALQTFHNCARTAQARAPKLRE